MNKRTCSIADCDRPYRARGLCASHYNQEFAKDRHKKKLVECTVCGARMLKGTGGGNNRRPVCSYECRTVLVKQDGPREPRHCRLPDDHWARWFGKASEWPRYGWRDCAYCGERFAPRTSIAKCCSPRCSWRRHARENATYLQSDMAQQVRECRRCKAPYQSPYVGRVHCSDLCRDRDKRDRGAILYHGWIADSIRAAIYERDEYTCWLCNEPVEMDADPKRDDWAPSLDHVVPRSLGGSHDESNLRTAHRWCNSVRSDSGVESIFDLAV